ncbi:hypothetical protein BGZ46_003466 [Entomortierella lignicola]|nr:hypothetical protein BGZ46_003466 [Entomortierella lignicola]
MKYSRVENVFCPNNVLDLVPGQTWIYTKVFYMEPTAHISLIQSRSMAAEQIQEVNTINHGVSETTTSSFGTAARSNVTTSTTTTTTTAQRNPSSKPHRSRSIAIHDSPLFSRRSTGRRWPIGTSTAKAPKYRIVQERVETVHLSGNEFDPFVKYPTAKSIQRLGWTDEDESQRQLTTPFNFWAVDSLPLATSNRHKSWRGESAKIGPGVNPHTTLDEALGVTNESRNSVWLAETVDPESITSSPTLWPFGAYELDKVQLGMVEELVKKIESQTSTITQQELTVDLQRLGRVTLLRGGLSLSFVDSPSNQQDVIGIGLDTLVSTLLQSKDFGWATNLVEILNRNNMLLPLDTVSVGYLRKYVTMRDPPNRSRAARSHKRSLLEALDKVRGARSAKQIDHEEWKVQTRRFRIQLAIARETGVMPSESEYLRFMECCQRAGHMQELELTFHHYLDFHPESAPKSQQSDEQGYNHQRSEKIYREYIKGLVRGNRIDHAQEVLHSMKRKGIIPSVVTYGIMIEGYGQQMDFRKMRLTLKSMQASGHSLTIEIYTSLMSNYIRAREIERADEVYRELFSRTDIQIDANCENVIENLKRLGGGKDIPEKTMSQPNSSLSEEPSISPGPSSSSPSSPSDLDPESKDLNNVIYHNHKLKFYADSMKPNQFANVYKSLLDSGSKPNTSTLNILINTLVKAYQLEDGLEVLEYMKQSEKEKPDVVTFATLINGAVNERKVDLGWHLYLDMRIRSIVPNIYVYVSLIELAGLEPTNKVGRAIVKQYSVPGERKFRFPVKSNVEEQVGLNFAGEIYNQLCLQGLKPNHHVFCSLIDLTVRGGYMDLAQHVYQEMHHQNIIPNTAIMTALIKGFAIRRDFESGWKAWRHMVEHNIPRNVITYNHLIRLCERSLPNPITMAELLEAEALDTNNNNSITNNNNDEMKHSDKRADKRHRLAKEKELKKIRAKADALTNTTRIPLEVMNEIRAQMEVDRVSWFNVGQHRLNIPDPSVWAPVVTKVKPVYYVREAPTTAPAAVTAESEDPSVQSSHNNEVNDKLELSSTSTLISEGETLSSLATAPDTENALVIREITVGGGDMYVRKRIPGYKRRLGWSAETLRPLLKKLMPAAATEKNGDNSLAS